MKNVTVDIANYDKFTDFFRAFILSQKRINPVFSYRWFSNKIGLKSKSLVAMVASGQRRPTDDFLNRLSEFVFNWSELQFHYARLISNTQGIDSPSRLEFLAQEIVRIRTVLQEESKLRAEQIEASHQDAETSTALGQ